MNEEIYGWIYGLQSPSGKWYIGQTTSREPLEYIRSNYEVGKGYRRPKLKRAIEKYGFGNFKVTLINKYYSKDTLDAAEINYIQEYNCLGNNGYNCRLGGNGAGKHSEETKNNISNSKRGKTVGLDNHFAKSRTIQNIATGEILQGCISVLAREYGFDKTYIVVTGEDSGFKLLYETPKKKVAKKGTPEFNLKNKLKGMKRGNIITIRNTETGEEHTGALRALERDFGIHRKWIMKKGKSKNYIKVETTTSTQQGENK